MSDETMIERVGRAIESKWNSLQDLPPIELTAEEAGELGRAAIEAMRIDALEPENARLREALKPFSSETMIERVAKAMICVYPKAGRTFGESSQLPRQVFTDLAIATIEAMRRPTLVMLRAAWAADESHTIPRDELVKAYPGEDMPPPGDVGFVLDYDNKGLEVIVGAWEAMIDAALNEKAAADP